MTHILLASSSPFRKELLQRLGIVFDTCSPDVDESYAADEPIEKIVARLAEAKANALLEQYPGSLIIGSDQLATLNNTILSKPGNHENAVKQLQLASGNEVTFYTGLCLLNAKSGQSQVDVIKYSVMFRALGAEQIENYLNREQPYNCAGSFKSEGLGVALFDKMQGDDPTALIGLPLIRLTDMLAREDVDILALTD